MRVIVEFHDESRDHATVTMVPSWFGRLLGRRSRVARVQRWAMGWEYAVDRTNIYGDLETTLNEARRWQEQSELPAASLVADRGRSLVRMSMPRDLRRARDMKVLALVVVGGGFLAVLHELLRRLGVL